MGLTMVWSVNAAAAAAVVDPIHWLHTALAARGFHIPATTRSAN